MSQNQFQSKSSEEKQDVPCINKIQCRVLQRKKNNKRNTMSTKFI